MTELHRDKDLSDHGNRGRQRGESCTSTESVYSEVTFHTFVDISLDKASHMAKLHVQGVESVIIPSFWKEKNQK